MNGTEIFHRTRVFEQEAPMARLQRLGWDILYSFNGTRDLHQVSETLKVPKADLEAYVHDFVSRGWIEEEMLSLDQYLRENRQNGETPQRSSYEADKDGPPSMPGEFTPDLEPEFAPRSLIDSDLASEEVVALNPTKNESKLVEPSKSAPVMVEQPVAPPPPPRRKILLKEVVAFLTKNAEPANVAPLLVYYVFSKLDLAIVDAAGLSSVQLVNDPGEFENEALQNAISLAVYEVIKKPLPESVFAVVS